MERAADATDLSRALVDLQHQLDMLLDDLEILQTVAQTVSPDFMKTCRHIELLLTEAEAVLRVPDLLGPDEKSRLLH